MEDIHGDARFLAQLDFLFESHIQEAGIDDPTIEREYKRAIADAKEAYRSAHVWKPDECSVEYKDDLGRLLASSAMQKGLKRAELAHVIFKAGETRFGTEAMTGHMTSSRADELYEVAHQQAFPPGYPYTPLKPQQFRLLTLLPAHDQSAPLRCRLHHGTPADSQYSALSYVWGQKDPQSPVYIELESQILEVTPNLHAALLQLRHPTQKTTIWVDAICINQKDLAERAEQVKLMTAIYESASSVLMWLGPSTGSSDTTMRFLVDYANKMSQGSERINLLPRSFEIQAGLIAIISRSYWTRAWIMQEVVVSRTAYICCGSYVTGWNAFASLLIPLDPLESLDLQMREQCLSIRAVQLSAHDLVWPLAELNIKKRKRQRIACWEGLQMARQRGATDPRDYVYSLLGFVDAMPVEVDYTISATELYRSLVMNFIRQDKNLDILTMCRNFNPNIDGGHQTASERLTSDTVSRLSGMLQLLVLNTRSMFQSSAPKEPETGHEDQGRAQNHTAEDMNTQALENSKQAQTRLHLENKSTSDSDNLKAEGTATVPGARAPESNPADSPRSEQVLPSWVPRWNINELHPGVQIALDPRRLASCSSSGSHGAKVTFTKDGERLIARGILIDVVDRCHHESLNNHTTLIGAIGTSQQPGSVDATWQRFLQEWSTWESFVNDREVTRYQSLGAQREAYVDIVMMGLDVGDKKNQGSYYDLMAMRLDWPLKGAHAGNPSTWRSDAFADSQKHTFVITKTGYMGRGPKTMRTGDVICILYGGRIPFALRPVGSEFHLLGECYVSGAMKGELVSWLSRRHFPEQYFVLK